MAYVSLYRKYRPQTFDEVVGQGHVTTTLANAIEEGRLHHAYLFTGPRGTGKTSTARILAKAVNCEEGPTATPCNDCDLCVAITQGSSVDVIELDMASHGGVDDARDLRERARFSPAGARRKVYILDEVHMASTAAFNALLKLIEEPPDHVIFAMATTDPQKVIPTVMSRVQRLDLRRVAAPEVAAHVRAICGSEGYEIEDGAVDAVVRAGDGSVRDALSVLEQVLSFSGRTVTTESVRQVLGQTPFERTAAAVDAFVAGDLRGVMTLVQDLQDEGTDLRRFAFDLLQHLRDLLVLGAAPGRPDLVDATDERRDELAVQAEAVPRDTLLHAVDVLAEAVTEMRLGPPRLPLELALATLATPSVSPDLTALNDRVARLERDRPADGGPDAAASIRSDGDPGQAVDRDDGAARRSAPEVGAGTTPEDRPPAGGPDEGDAGAGADGEGAEGEGAARDGAPGVRGTDTAGAREARTAAATDDVDVDAGSGETAAGEIGTGEPDDGAGGGAAEGIDGIRQRWDAILDMVKEESRRVHAVYEPAEPVGLRNRILTLRYPSRYASFHADQAGRGQYSQALTAAIERATGLRVRIDAVVEGEETRRPQPPMVTSEEQPSDPPEPSGPTLEAEQAHRISDEDPGEDTAEAMARAQRLLEQELDAVRLDEGG